MSKSFLNNIDNSWTLFLDRDGVINKRIFGGYVTNPDEFEFIPGALESIVYFSTIFNRIIIITNQQGVDKGLMTEPELITLHEYMTNKITKAGGKIDAIYYCTNLASKQNSCRKPSTKMANNALADFPDIDTSKSIMVGDSPSDIEFGINAGMKTIFILSQEGNISDHIANLSVNSLEQLQSMLQSTNQ